MHCGLFIDFLISTSWSVHRFPNIILHMCKIFSDRDHSLKTKLTKEQTKNTNSGQITVIIVHFWKQAPKLAHILLGDCSFDKTR